jgi:hypothetical protein
MDNVPMPDTDYTVTAKKVDKNDNDRLFLLKIIGDEKFRLKTAISLSRNRKHLSEITGIEERTLFRRIKKYGLQNEPNSKQ